ncbi:hypothetical protein ABZV60_19840 [Streptomyces sp. NPDC004787]|uniref:hypothetical protein n=1 Tax=Streptomyces sp. NPDC004787 TaxID=3154291 RepID=UPI0033B4F3C9
MSKQTADAVQDAPERVRLWAQEHSICLVPVLPEAEDRVVLLDADCMELEEFLGIAFTLGVRVLYLDIECFDADEFAVLPAVAAAVPGEDLPDPEADLDAAERKQLAVLRAAARPRHGQIAAVRLCFVADSVAHFWGVTAPWAEQLDDQWDDFTALLQMARRDRQEQAHAAEQVDTLAEVERMAAVLAALPAFRAARNQAARKAVAMDTFPDSDVPPVSYLLSRAVGVAAGRVEADAAIAWREVEESIGEVAGKLAASGVMEGATTKPARRIKAADFLTSLTGGFPPPTRTLTLLLDHPALTLPRPRAAARPAADTLPLA